jgi:uncharacterized phage protein gp47/JayE
MANNTPMSIDYTTRDFYALKADLVSRIQTRLKAAGKTWNATDPGDFGVVMAEAFAYIGDVTNYYIDRMANETQLVTATQRQNILNMAAAYGYIPSGYRQASVPVTFSNSGASSFTIPAGTEFVTQVTTTNTATQTSVQLYYTLQYDVTIPAKSGVVNGTASGYLAHGSNVTYVYPSAGGNDIAGEFVGNSSGIANQTFVLGSSQIADGSIAVFVQNGDYYALWTQVLHLSDYGPADSVYSLVTDSNNNVYVQFGDGTSGAIPAYGSSIKAQYTIGGGIIGNLSSNSYTFYVNQLPAGSGLTVSNFAAITVSQSGQAYGGEDPESNESIRANAPTAIATLQRAVTINDFKNLAITVPGVGKATAYALTPNSVSVYVGPVVSDTSTEYYPGFDANNTTIQSAWYSLQSTVNSFFTNKTQIGTTVTTLPPTYVPVNIDVQYTKTSAYTDAQIQTAIKSAIVYGYGYNYLNFDQTIYPEQIEAYLSSIPGILSVKVVHLYRHSGSVARNALQPAAGEFFVFQDNSTAGTYFSTYPSAGLINLTTTAGTLSPTFNSGTFSYTTTTALTTATVTATVPVDVANTITINGTTVASGVASGSITIPLGTSTITVVVTSPDATVSNTYTIRVTR